MKNIVEKINMKYNQIKFRTGIPSLEFVCTRGEHKIIELLNSFDDNTRLTHKYIANQTFQSLSSVNRCLINLRKKGYVESKQISNFDGNAGGSRTSFIINWDIISNDLEVAFGELNLAEPEVIQTLPTPTIVKEEVKVIQSPIVTDEVEDEFPTIEGVEIDEDDYEYEEELEEDKPEVKFNAFNSIYPLFDNSTDVENDTALLFDIRASLTTNVTMKEFAEYIAEMKYKGYNIPTFLIDFINEK